MINNQLKTCQDFLDVENVNITANSSWIVAFSESHQILAIPQAELLTRAHRIRGERRQNNLRGQRVISGNLRPLSLARREELTRRSNVVVIWSCNHNVDILFATAPERPIGTAAISTGYVPAQVNQFHASNLATVRDTEGTILVIFRAKTHWTRTDFEPRS